MGLVWDHSSNSSPQDLRRGLVVIWSLFWVREVTLSSKPLVLHLLPNESTGNADLFGPHGNNLLPVKKLLGNNGSQAAEHVPSTVNHNNLNKKKTKKYRVSQKEGGKKGLSFQRGDFKRSFLFSFFSLSSLSLSPSAVVCPLFAFARSLKVFLRVGLGSLATSPLNRLPSFLLLELLEQEEEGRRRKTKNVSSVVVVASGCPKQSKYRTSRNPLW
mmetsp:Transcript_7666/g.14256  ORF Transcript_7666/g.14256 Transcript_7666/m.14256 type:complete len:215 (+) Transcript_7666:1466-2110(+)